MSSDIACAFCAENLSSLPLDGRQAHYESHLQDEVSQAYPEHLGPQATTSGSASTPKLTKRKNKPWNKKIRYPVKETDEFWHAGQGTLPPNNFTPGLVEVLKWSLLKCHAKGTVVRASLCHPATVHISRQLWDAGWGCGYRNFLMVCTALFEQSTRPQYKSLLGKLPPLGIRSLQSWIETAWADGFDPEGAAQVGGLSGTSKWIGTADLWVACSYIGIPAQLTEFNLARRNQGVKPLLDWVTQYFSPNTRSMTVTEALRGASTVTITDCMPLILQRKGHSYTVIGYEVETDGSTNLLIFDSSFLPNATLRMNALATIHGNRAPPTIGPEGSTQRLFTPLKRSRDELEDELVVLGNRPAPSPLANKLRLGPSNIPPDPIKYFRLKPSRLSKFDEYQILYFTMAEPLSDSQRMERRIVTSTQGC